MADDPATSEKGLKWWARYVIVLLLGGGGVFAILVATIGKPSAVPGSSSSQDGKQPQAAVQEVVTFYASSKMVARETANIAVQKHEVVLLHWEVLNSKGSFLLRGTSFIAEPVQYNIGSRGVQPVIAEKTTDYTLEEFDAAHNGRTLGSVRVSVPDQ